MIPKVHVTFKDTPITVLYQAVLEYIGNNGHNDGIISAYRSIYKNIDPTASKDDVIIMIFYCIFKVLLIVLVIFKDIS